MCEKKNIGKTKSVQVKRKCDNKSYIHKNKNIFVKLILNQGEGLCPQIGEATSMSRVSDSRCP